MKTRTIVLLALACSHWAVYGYDVTLRVEDDRGEPLEHADAVISFVGAVQGTSDEHHGQTDKNGRFSARGSSLIEVFVSVKKEGYYKATLEHLHPRKDHDLKVVLPRVMKATRLYARRVSIGPTTRQLPLPEHDRWHGFDLLKGDWLAPYGGGKTADFEMRFRNTYVGYRQSGRRLEKSIELSKKWHAANKKEWSEERYRLTAGNWDAELEIRFPGEKEGLVEVKDRFLPYSRMKMPHEAPTTGYQPTLGYAVNNYSPPTARKDVGFFLRTRVKLDEKGDIRSAHYAKVMGDFAVFAAGGIAFTYYFNPESNDRNLEFDPAQNLFPEEPPRTNVFDP